MNKITVPEIVDMKKRGDKVVMVTAYDAGTARIIDDAGVDIILVGDSLGNVIQGLPNTLSVTVDEMVYHTKLVTRGAQKAHVCADMPFMSYQLSMEEALRNASRFIKEAGAQSVKLETTEDFLDTIHEIQKTGIPVMGHIGLRPQDVHKMGGYKIQGRDKNDAAQLKELAKKAEDAGAYALVLESIPRRLAAEITDSIKIPTIGIGAGPECDGQVLVINDLVGLSPGPMPKFVKKYANVKETMENATKEFISEVRQGTFPAEAHSYD
jgi:3-methyl-2-oxobutanoate hydroxymethyltransferase